MAREDDSETVSVRVPRELVDLIDQWRNDNRVLPNRSQVILMALREFFEREGMLRQNKDRESS